MPFAEALCLAENKLGGSVRPQYHDEFHRRFALLRPELLRLLHRLKLLTEHPNCPHSFEYLRIYLVGSCAAYLIGRVDTFDRFEFVALTEGSDDVWFPSGELAKCACWDWCRPKTCMACHSRFTFRHYWSRNYDGPGREIFGPRFAKVFVTYNLPRYESCDVVNLWGAVALMLWHPNCNIEFTCDSSGSSDSSLGIIYTGTGLLIDIDTIDSDSMSCDSSSRRESAGAREAVTWLYIDECECWWHNQVLVRAYDDRYDKMASEHELTNASRVDQWMRVGQWMQSEQRLHRLDASRRCPDSAVRSFLDAIWVRAFPHHFVNWGTRRSMFTSPSAVDVCNYKEDCGFGYIRMLLCHLRSAAPKYHYDVLAQMSALTRKHCSTHTLNFLKPYCECCRARERLALACIALWRFDAHESFDSRWFRELNAHYAAEPRMQSSGQVDNGNIMEVSRRQQLMKRIVLRWAMLAALAKYVRLEKFLYDRAMRDVESEAAATACSGARE